MISLFYQKLAPTLQGIHHFCNPYLLSMQVSISKISTLFERMRTFLEESWGENRVVIIAGTSAGLSLYWLYLFFFEIPIEDEAKRRPPIPPRS